MVETVKEATQNICAFSEMSFFKANLRPQPQTKFPSKMTMQLFRAKKQSQRKNSDNQIQWSKRRTKDKTALIKSVGTN